MVGSQKAICECEYIRINREWFLSSFFLLVDQTFVLILIKLEKKNADAAKKIVAEKLIKALSGCVR